MVSKKNFNSSLMLILAKKKKFGFIACRELKKEGPKLTMR